MYELSSPVNFLTLTPELQGSGCIQAGGAICLTVRTSFVHEEQYLIDGKLIKSLEQNNYR